VCGRPEDGQRSLGRRFRPTHWEHRVRKNESWFIEIAGQAIIQRAGASRLPGTGPTGSRHKVAPPSTCHCPITHPLLVLNAEHRLKQPRIARHQTSVTKVQRLARLCRSARHGASRLHCRGRQPPARNLSLRSTWRRGRDVAPPARDGRRPLRGAPHR
jgi:hypothetical protein